MALGLKVFGPAGQVWLDTSLRTVRIHGMVTLSSSGTTSGTVTVPLTGDAKPAVFGYGYNGCSIAYTANASTGQINYSLDWYKGYNGTYPRPASGGAILFYGVQ